MKVVIKTVTDYAPRLYKQGDNLICDTNISSIIENYAEKIELDKYNLDLYTKCYEYLESIVKNYKGIYFCEDKFKKDLVPFLDNLLLNHKKA